MSEENASAGASVPWPPSRPNKRLKMRNGTFIIPSTGERSREQFTLRASTAAHASSVTASRFAQAETVCDHCVAIVDDGKSRLKHLWRWLCSDQGRQVLKCTIAYVLGSMATFWPVLSGYLGERDGKHIVATLTVFFHPARTTGSMLEAILIAIAAIIYADLVCLLSMAVAILSRKHLDSVIPAHAMILLMAIGGGLGFIAWVKQRLDQPLVNVASTLASIAIVSMITKDDSILYGYFSTEKFIQVFKMLLIGITFSAAVNILVWPMAARSVLRDSIITASSTLSDRLLFVTRGFLVGSEDEVKSPEYSRVSKSYTAAYGLMTKTLPEAKFEYYLLGQERIYSYDKRLVKSLQSVSQAIGGLRSSLNTQFMLLGKSAEAAEENRQADDHLTLPKTLRRLNSTMDTVKRLSVIEEDDEHYTSNLRADPALGQVPVFREPSDIFALFMALLGPSMKSLAYTLTEILRQSPFGEDAKNEIVVSEQLRESLLEALSLYNSARAGALREVYKSKELGRVRSEATKADIEEVAAACGHFSFNLQAVAEEMSAYLDILEDLKHSTESMDRSWNWLKFWKYRRATQDVECQDPECKPLLERRQSGIRRSALPKGIPKFMMKQHDNFNWDASSQSKSWARSLSQTTLGAMRLLSREDVLFGLKIGIGAVLWAMFAFIPATRPTYQKWKGEWGLLSYMVVVGMTNGASNTTSLSRFLGTLIGAVCACAAWFISFENAYLLAIFGFFMALGNFYMILVIKNGPLGRISLLAYNVIVLYAYSLSQSDDNGGGNDEEDGKHPLIFDITYHRVVAVTLGIVWGMLFCRILWPISGRTKFRQSLAVLYLQLGLIWKRGPLTSLMESDSRHDFMDAKEEAALQRYAFKLETLRTSAKSEFELRGPFPNKAYSRILHSTNHILDSFYAMRLISEHRTSLSAGERALLDFTTAERVQLCHRISHVFQVLASCVMLEYPLTDVIPTIENSKDRLLHKIYEFRKDQLEAQLRLAARDECADGAAGSSAAERAVGADAGAKTLAAAVGGESAAGGGGLAQELSCVEVLEKDYALLYAYILVTVQVAADLKQVRQEVERLFGVLQQHDMLLE